MEQGRSGQIQTDITFDLDFQLRLYYQEMLDTKQGSSNKIQKA